MRLGRRRRLRYQSDHEAALGNDGIESACKWARHILQRDFSDQEVGRAILVVETLDGEGKRNLFYAASDPDMAPVSVGGLLSTAQLLVEQMMIHARIDHVMKSYFTPIMQAIRPEEDPP